MATATAGELVRAAGSHYIGIESYQGRLVVGKEELYPIVSAEWLGKELRVELSADRYTYTDSEANSPRMGEWRIYVRGARAAEANERGYSPEVNLSDVARQKLNAVCVPIVREWLESDEYEPARRRTFAHTIRREFREHLQTTYGVEHARRVLDTFGPELDPAEQKHLRHLIGLAEELAAGLDTHETPVQPELAGKEA